MLQYIDEMEICRSVQLVSHFGEEDSPICGICSVCTKESSDLNRKEAKLISEKILLLLEEGELSSREISERLTFTETKILKVIKLLMDAEKIRNKFQKPVLFKLRQEGGNIRAKQLPF